MLPFYLKYANNLFVRQKRLIEKDHYKRILALKREYYLLSKNIIERNEHVPQSAIFFLHNKLYQHPKISKRSSIKNKCVITGRKHGINSRFKLSGLFLKLNPGHTYLLTRYNK